MFNPNINDLIDNVAFKLIDSKRTVSVVESCTGGFLSTCLTSISGASKYFKGSVVAYNNSVKENLLNISPNFIIDHGVVSRHVVELMAINIKSNFNTHFGLATTGYLDNANSTSKKPPSLHAWIAVSSNNYVKSEHIYLHKSRKENIYMVSEALLRLFVKQII